MLTSNTQDNMPGNPGAQPGAVGSATGAGDPDAIDRQLKGRRGAYLKELPIRSMFTVESVMKKSPGDIDDTVTAFRAEKISESDDYSVVGLNSEAVIMWHSDGSTSGFRTYSGIEGRGYFRVADEQPDGTDLRKSDADTEREITEQINAEQRTDDNAKPDEPCDCAICQLERQYGGAAGPGKTDTFRAANDPGVIRVRSEAVDVIEAGRAYMKAIGELRGKLAGSTMYDEAAQASIENVVTVVGLLVANLAVDQ